ncbi:MAG: hypothetical protein LBD32_02470 [Cytophagales bacterium]|jgi:methionyl-tRNA synthetase|nr:hypothetical protein [Cytophagales bacterium]
MITFVFWKIRRDRQNKFAEGNVLIDKIEQDLEIYRFGEVLQFWMKIARKWNKYITETEPWKLQKIFVFIKKISNGLK